MKPKYYTMGEELKRKRLREKYITIAIGALLGVAFATVLIVYLFFG